MQLAMTPEVLLALGAGAVMLAVGLVLVLVRRHRRRIRRGVPAIGSTGASVPAGAPLTVAAPVGRTAHGGAEQAAGPQLSTSDDPPPPGPPPSPSSEPAHATAPAAGPDPLAPMAGSSATDPAPTGVATASWSEPAPSGSARTVAAAVVQALAVRDARARTTGPHGPAAAIGPPGPDGPKGDPRDRLLAVLLDDPALAVSAAAELAACRHRLDRLGEQVRHERASLSDVLGRLSEAGLSSGQLGRLSGLSDDEIRSLLPRHAMPRSGEGHSDP